VTATQRRDTIGSTVEDRQSIRFIFETRGGLLMTLSHRVARSDKRITRSLKPISFGLTAALALLACNSLAHAQLIHRYSFTTDTSDSVGGANGTLVNNTLGNPFATVSGGQLNLNNPGFSGPSSQSNYLSLPPSIVPASGSVTIESWFTFTGSGFFTEDWTFSNNMNDTNVPNQTNGQYLMHTISAPQGGPVPAGGGSHVAQALNGYQVGSETDAFGTTPLIGAGGGGYLDDGETFMAATVIDGAAGTMSYYLYDLTPGSPPGGLQQTIPAIPLSSYSFTNAYLGRSAFAGDNATSGSIDEFRIYANARSAADIAADFAAGPNQLVPEPSSLVLAGLGSLGLIALRQRRRRVA
jgi:hypothetical protein